MVRLLSFFFVLFFLIPHARADDWIEAPHVKLRFLYAGYNPAKNEHVGALEFAIDDGWKIYWRTPGDSGIPVKINDTGSENLASVSILWPNPTRTVEFDGLESFGYKKHVIIPILFTPDDPETETEIEVTVEYAVCEQICIFGKELINETLDDDIKVDDSTIQEIQKVISNISQRKSNKDITLSRFQQTQDKKLVFTFTSETPFEKPDLFIEAAPGFRFPQPEVYLSNEKRTATFHSPYEEQIEGKSVRDQVLTLTLTDSAQSMEKSVRASDAVLAEIVEAPSLSLMLAFAILGGFILNFMPCVLPVLSIKILSFVKHSGSSRKTIRRSFIASTLGIIFSFLALAGLVVLLRNIGMQVGWGFQFQSPVFLAVMAIIIFFFALNLFGAIELRLPSFLATRLSHMASRDEQKLLSHFLSGALATLLATPCTAPFLGTAIGFAFSQSSTIILLMFTAMGTGLALPYILVGLFPGLVKIMPKPGAWMIKLKAFFGILLIATAAWLLYILFAPMQKTESAAPSEISWVAFEPEKISTYVKQGNVVFLDITADWCLTCKANKKIVIDTAEIQTLLREKNTVAMRGDWTKPSQEIADFLSANGRFGIPFNAVYGPTSPQGILLPEVLTQQLVKDALAKAR